MKFSDREQLLIEYFKSYKCATLSELVWLVQSHSGNSMAHMKPLHVRNSVSFSVRKLSKKLSIFGIDLVRINPVGRGNMAVYEVSQNIAAL